MKKNILIIFWLLLICQVATAQLSATGVRFGNSKVLGMANFSGVLTENINEKEIAVLSGYLALKTAASDLSISATGQGAAMSSDGSLMVVARNDASRLTSYKWSSTNNRYEATAAPDALPSGAGRIFAMSNDGAFLAFVHTGGVAPARLATYKWSEANNRYELTANSNAVLAATYDCSMTADGSKLAVAHNDTSYKYVYTYKWSSANNRYEKTADIYPTPTSLPGRGCSLSADGTRLVRGKLTGIFETYLWSEANNRYEKTTDPVSAGNSYGIRMSKDGNFVVTTDSYDNAFLRAHKWSAENGRYELLPAIKFQPNVKDTYQYVAGTATTYNLIALSSDGSYLLVSSFDPYLPIVYYKFNTTTNTYERLPAPDISLGSRTNAYGAAMTDDGSRFCIAHSVLNNRIFTSYALPDLSQAVYSIYKKETEDLMTYGYFNPNILAYGYLDKSGTTGQTKTMSALWWMLYGGQ